MTQTPFSNISSIFFNHFGFNIFSARRTVDRVLQDGRGLWPEMLHSVAHSSEVIAERTEQEPWVGQFKQCHLFPDEQVIQVVKVAWLPFPNARELQ